MIELILLIIAIGNFLLRGVVFVDIWNWFPATILGVPSITFVGALGLLLIASFLKTLKFDTKDKNKEILTSEEKIGRSLTVTVFYLFTWLVGWIITLFM